MRLCHIWGTEADIAEALVLMGSKFNRLVADIARPPLEAVGVVARGIYRLLFGRADARLSRKREAELGFEIQRDVSILFNEFHGKIVPDKSVSYPRPFNYASVIVASDQLVWRFFRGREELRVWVAPKSAPTDWEELPLVLDAIHSDCAHSHSIIFLEDVARLLQTHMDMIKQALSPNGYTELKERLSDVHKHERAVIRQWETEINRRLYPNK